MSSLKLLVISKKQKETASNLRVIKDAGYTVEACRIDESDHLKNHLESQHYDLVLLDFCFPSSDVQELFNILKEKKIDWPVIVITEQSNEEKALSLFESGASDVIRQGDSLRLVSVVKRELQKSERKRKESQDKKKWLEQNLKIIEQNQKVALEAQKSSQQSEEHFQSFANSIAQLAWMARPDGSIYWFNKRWYEYTGTKPEDMESWGWKNVHDPSQLPRVLDIWQRAVREGEPAELSFPLKGADGRFRWFLTRVTPLKDSSGKVVRWVGTNTDIDEIKRTQEDQQFLTKLSTTLGGLSDLEDVVSTAASSLSVYLKVSRCFLAEIDDKESLAVVHHDHSQGLPSLKGQYDLSQFGPGMVESWRDGPVVILNDVNEDPRTRDHAGSHLALGICSFITAPIIKGGQLVGALNATSHEPREWSPRETELVRLVAESTWSAFENARLLFALTESESRFRQLADSMPQMVWIATAEGSPILFNRKWSEYTGFSADQLLKREWSGLIHSDDLPQLTEKWEKAKVGGAEFEAEYRIQDREDNYRWFLARAVAAEGAQNKIIHWYGTATDIDNQKRKAEFERFMGEATAALSSSLNYEETLKRVAHMAVPTLADWCVVDLLEEDGPHRSTVAHADPSMAPLVKKLQEKYPPDWGRNAGAPNVIRTGKSEIYREVSEELLISAAQDEEHLHLIKSIGMRSGLVVPIAARGRSLGALTLVSTDPSHLYSDTELALAEELGRRAGIAVDNALLYEQTQKAVRMRDEFLSIASHELKTPLTSLKLQAQIRKRSMTKGDYSSLQPEKAKKIVEDDERQIERLTHLIDDMLDVSRLHSGKFAMNIEKMDLCELCDDVITRFAPQIQAAGCELTFVNCEPVIATWDRYRLEQVFTNLLTNAIRYGAGHPIEVRVSSDELWARLSIRDRGIGIAKEHQRRIFQQFERAVESNEVSGLGLGLFIVHQIVEAHKGRVLVQSDLGQGSEFIVELPLNYGDDKRSEAAFWLPLRKDQPRGGIRQ